MTWMLIAGISWMLIAVSVAIILGRSISMRDEHEAPSPASPYEPERRHRRIVDAA